MKKIILLITIVTSITIVAFSYYEDDIIYPTVNNNNYQDSKAEIISSKLNDIERRLQAIKYCDPQNISNEIDYVILEVRNLRDNINCGASYF